MIGSVDLTGNKEVIPLAEEQHSLTLHGGHRSVFLLHAPQHSHHWIAPVEPE
jgi:hypothetical protein